MSNSRSDPTDPPVGTESESPIFARVEVIMKSMLDEAKTKADGPSRIVPFIDLVKVLTWPTLILVFVIVFFQPIHKTLNLIPVKIEAASKASVGSLSWEIERQARRQGGMDLARRVGNLSAAAIEELINTQRDTQFQMVSDDAPTYTLPNNDRLVALRELRDAGLISFTEPLESFLTFMTSLPLIDQASANRKRRVLRANGSLTATQRARLRNETYELTPTGVRAIDAIVRALVEQLQVAPS